MPSFQQNWDCSEPFWIPFLVTMFWVSSWAISKSSCFRTVEWANEWRGCSRSFYRDPFISPNHSEDKETEGKGGPVIWLSIWIQYSQVFQVHCGCLSWTREGGLATSTGVWMGAGGIPLGEFLKEVSILELGVKKENDMNGCGRESGVYYVYPNMD